MSGFADILPRLRIALRNPRWRVAIVVAAVSDAIAFLLIPVPFVQWGVDALTAIVLFIAFGFPWTLLLALAVEVIPGLQLFPAWTLAVLAIGAMRYKTDLLPPPESGDLPKR